MVDNVEETTHRKTTFSEWEFSDFFLFLPDLNVPKCASPAQPSTPFPVSSS